MCATFFMYKIGLEINHKFLSNLKQFVTQYASPIAESKNTCDILLNFDNNLK